MSRQFAVVVAALAVGALSLVPSSASPLPMTDTTQTSAPARVNPLLAPSPLPFRRAGIRQDPGRRLRAGVRAPA